MNFASDNVSPFCPEVLEALTKEASANAPAYGGDEISQKLDAAFSELFGKEVAVIPVATGTAANCISLSALVSPYGGVVCHHEAHINEDESTGVAFFTGGANFCRWMARPPSWMQATLMPLSQTGLIAACIRYHRNAWQLRRPPNLVRYTALTRSRRLARSAANMTCACSWMARALPMRWPI